MYVRLFVLAPILFFLGSVKACDVCGSVSGANDFGISSGWGRHYFGIQYQYRLFRSQHPTLFADETPVFYTNKFSAITAVGRYVPFKRLQIYGSLPYGRYSDSTVAISGLADASVRTAFAIIYKKDSSNNTSHTLWTNVGVKAPTGQSVNGTDNVLLPNMQPGSGSWDYTFGAHYFYKKNDWGLSTEMSYKRNTPNFYRQRFGDRFSTNTLFFKSFELMTLGNRIIPQIGVNYQLAAQDYLNISKNEINPYSGGSFAFASLGCDLIINKINISASWKIPVWQNYADGYVTALLQASVGIKYVIN